MDAVLAAARLLHMSSPPAPTTPRRKTLRSRHQTTFNKMIVLTFSPGIGTRSAGRFFGMPESTIREWRKKKAEIRKTFGEKLAYHIEKLRENNSCLLTPTAEDVLSMTAGCIRLYRKFGIDLDPETFGCLGTLEENIQRWLEKTKIEPTPDTELTPEVPKKTRKRKASNPRKCTDLF